MAKKGKKKKKAEKGERITTSELDIDKVLSSPTKRDEKVYSREELEAISKPDLIDIILTMQMSIPPHTEPIGTAPPTFPSETEITIVDFQMLPNARTIRIDDRAPISWKFILVNADMPDRPMGIELFADITIGRVSRESTPDLDLTLHGGALKGVSREHAMLRPMEDALMLVDLGSTNGTYVNQERMDPGGTTPIRDGDTISFAQLHFKIKVVQSPPGALT